MNMINYNCVGTILCFSGTGSTEFNLIIEIGVSLRQTVTMLEDGRVNCMRP
jgi:hypothetical protein